MNGLETAAEKVRELTGHALSAMDGLSGENEFLKNLVEHLMTRNK